MRLDDGARIHGPLVIGPPARRRESEDRLEPATLRASQVEDGVTTVLWSAGGYEVTGFGGRKRFVGLKGRGMPFKRPLRLRVRRLWWKLRGSPPLPPSTPDAFCEQR